MLFFSEQENRQTWYLCSLTRWAKRFANARSTLWRSWAKNAQTSCCSTSARQMKLGRRQTDRSVYLICIIYFCFKESWTCEMNFFFSHQRVMMQIVQELCRRPGLNKCGFEMPTIYIPNPQKVKWSVLVTLNCCVCIKITSGCANIINHSSAVIAAPSYDLQPRSVRGRFVHPSRPPLHFCWASAASLSAKSTRLSVRMPSGFVMELSRPSFIEMCRVFFMFSPNLTCLRAVCLM